MNEDGLNVIQSDDGLAADVRRLIAQSRERVARSNNAGRTLLYWRVGKRIQTEVLQNARAAYGKEIVSTLLRQSATEYGPGFGEKNLRWMVQFAETFPDDPPRDIRTLA